MLNGKLHFTRCHSSKRVGALPCLTLNSLLLQSPGSSVLQPPRRHSTKTLQTKRVFTARCATFWCTGVPWNHSRNLSTAAVVSFPARNRNTSFLKPRGKPKFRVRTKQENDEFLQALKEAEEEYRAQQDRESKDDRYEHKDGSQHDLDLDTSDMIAHPFFAVPDVRSPRFNGAQSPQPGPVEMLRSIHKLTRLSRSRASTTELERELYYLSHNDPHPIAIHNILQILINDRHIKPAAHHYEALILANTWPEYGSVNNIENIMSEMETHGIEVGAHIIAAVLKVLAIHPSPELSHRMLAMVERRWIQLSPQTHHHLAVAMIRTGQTELAAWTLDALREAQKPVRSVDREVIPDYMVVLLIAELVKKEDWEGVLRYFYKLRNRRAADREIPVEFWGWLLDRASAAARETTETALQSSAVPSSDGDPDLSWSPNAHHVSTELNLSLPAHHLTRTIFTLYVAPMSLQPSWTTLVNILHSAANTGTAWLADSVLATMTYLDGIDGRGRRIAQIPEDVKKLVETAKARAKENEDRALAAESEEQKQARRRKKEQELEKERKDRETESWYAELMARFENEKKAAANDDRGGEGEKDAHPTVTATVQSTQSIDTLSLPVRLSTVKQELSPSSRNQAENKNESGPSRKLPPSLSSSGYDEPYEALDWSTVPSGNLWPLFPKIDGLQSAHVDPWEALGPKSSARRKWTEAQEHYKQIARANRKKS